MFNFVVMKKPVSNYISDRRSNLLEDPHDQAYVTKLIKLENPATSLKVIFGANVTGSADVRVLYRLQRVDGGGETDNGEQPQAVGLPARCQSVALYWTARSPPGVALDSLTIFWAHRCQGAV